MLSPILCCIVSVFRAYKKILPPFQNLDLPQYTSDRTTDSYDFHKYINKKSPNLRSGILISERPVSVFLFFCTFFSSRSFFYYRSLFNNLSRWLFFSYHFSCRSCSFSFTSSRTFRFSVSFFRSRRQ